jgi:riboflavin kinase/FMN adenylyltransferase
MSVFFGELDGPVAAACRGSAVTIGNFDGVHRGHQHLLQQLRDLACRLQVPALALTFAPHPLQLLRPAQFQPLLTTLEDRTALLQAAGADHVLVLHTTPALLQLSPEEFFQRVLRRQLDSRALVPGFNFTFGKDRQGTVETLQALCQQAGLPCQPVPPLLLEGRPISSSWVRQELLQGQVARARLLLGRPYRLRGRVVPGQRRGQQLGFPTANLDDVATLVPGDGVYAGRADLAGVSWPAAISIGPNLTFGEAVRKVEAHLIGFRGELYGQALALDFVERLRDLRSFADPAELRRQLAADIEQVRRLATAL